MVMYKWIEILSKFVLESEHKPVLTQWIFINLSSSYDLEAVINM